MNDWRDVVVRLMRVPPEPAHPPGSTPRVFRAAPNFYYFKLITWFAGHVVAIFVIVPPILVLSMMSPRRTVPLVVVFIFWFLAIAGGVALLLRVTFGYLIVRLDYEMRWYMISDRAIRIREGIITVREKTIALANIQNTTVRQGPLQRILGIADVEVRTAGGGAGSAGEHGKGGQIGEPMHIGYFRGVDNAAEIRDIILAGVRRHRDTGLGDPDEHRGEEIDPAMRLLEETRALKEMLQSFL